MRLAIIVGTRPQIIKCIPVIRECLRRKEEFTLIDTGQHYNQKLNKIFFENLGLPSPDFNLGVGSGPHGRQTAKIIMGIETVLTRLKPSICLVPGDTNTALGAAIASVKLKIPISHLESGLRSFEEFMPEEVNRKVIDHISQLLFAPTHTSECNLITEGISKKRIVMSGDTMYDLFLQEKKKILSAPLSINAKSNQFVLLTIHRPENADSPAALTEIIQAIRSSQLQVILPIHPRTFKMLERFNLLRTIKKINNLTIIDPVDYHSLLKLVRESLCVLTDSGGLQKEALFSRVPCITLRRTTEWAETVKLKVNFLVPRLVANDISSAMQYVIENRKKIVKRLDRLASPYGDGNASRKIVEKLKKEY